MFISEDIKYVGVNDHELDLFEGLYEVPNGMAYNSYIIMDEKIAVMDSVDRGFTKQMSHSLKAVENLLKSNGVKVFDSIEAVAEFLNNEV